MSREFTAVVQKDGKWWIGWVEEVRGVNAQAKTKKQLLANLQECLEEFLEVSVRESRKSALPNYETVMLQA